MRFHPVNDMDGTKQLVLVFGGVTYDSLVYMESLPQPIPGTVFSSRFHETVGGTGAGKALNLNRLGFDVSLHALVGDDPQGQAIRDYFKQEKLKFYADLDPKGTERHINIMASDGGRLSIYANYATFEPDVDTAQIAPLIDSCDTVALNIINYCRQFIPAIQAAGKPIWCDIHDYDGTNDYHQDFINAADVIFMSSDALSDYRAFMKALIAQGKQWVVCTHGKHGATALTSAGEWIETPIVPYELVDSNGAGDSYFSGVLYGHVHGYPIEKCLRLGAITAGLCITSPELVADTLSPATVEAEYKRIFGA